MDTSRSNISSYSAADGDDESITPFTFEVVSDSTEMERYILEETSEELLDGNGDSQENATQFKYMRTESARAPSTSMRQKYYQSNISTENEPLMGQRKTTKNKFARIFSNPSFATMSHENSSQSLVSIQKRSVQVTGGGGKIEERKGMESDSEIQARVMEELNKSSGTNVRHTRMVPVPNHRGREAMMKSESSHVPGSIASGLLPSNYVDPRGSFPAKDAYIQSIKTQFFGLGFSFGSSLQMFFVSIMIMFISTSSDAGPIHELSHEYYPVFRGVFLICYFFLLYGVSIFVWRRSKIKFDQVLRVSYAHTYQFILRGSTSTANIVFICFMLFIMTITGGIDISSWDRDVMKHIWPAMAFFIPLILFLCPFDVLTEPFYGVKKNGFAQRFDLIKEIGFVLCTPFTKGPFHRCFIADILCSMPKVFPDLQYTFCIYLTGKFWEPESSRYEWKTATHIHAYPTCGGGSQIYTFFQLALGLMPFHIRLWQCIRSYADSRHQRHLWNALKYTLALTLTVVATARNWFDPYTNDILGRVWVVVGITATLYSIFWDIFMDWGLGEKGSPHFMLRKNLVFKPSTYYTAIVLNSIMRLGWALVISPYQPYVQQHIILVLGAVEITRRFVWSIIRIEWEYTKHLQHVAETALMKGRDSNRSNQSITDVEDTSAILTGGTGSGDVGDESPEQEISNQRVALLQSRNNNTKSSSHQTQHHNNNHSSLNNHTQHLLEGIVGRGTGEGDIHGGHGLGHVYRSESAPPLPEGLWSEKVLTAHQRAMTVIKVDSSSDDEDDQGFRDSRNNNDDVELVITPQHSKSVK